MPAYTIMFMRKDSTDSRPRTIHISTRLFWSVALLAVALPVAGFVLSAGWVAPAWLKLNVKSMEAKVQKAEETTKQNEGLSDTVEKLKAQLDTERKARAEAEARVTMAETARTESTSRLTELEGESINLKRSLATYERLLKPKLTKELVQCVDMSASYANGQVTYGASFSKISSAVTLPDNLVARVRVLAGDNAVAMEGGSSAQTQVNVPLSLAKQQRIKGSMALNLPPDTTRLLDIKVFQDTQVIGYCWKSF